MARRKERTVMAHGAARGAHAQMESGTMMPGQSGQTSSAEQMSGSDSEGMGSPQSNGGEMPAFSMSGNGTGAEGGDQRGPQNVLIEMRIPAREVSASAFRFASGLNLPSLKLDFGYEPIPIAPSADQKASLEAAGEQTVVVRGQVEQEKIAELEALPNVVKVWKDTRIEAFTTTVSDAPTEEKDTDFVEPTQGFAACPIGTCDCAPGTPKGTINDVAAYLGADQIWAAGFKGENIVVGVVDGGITAQGRSINSNDTSDPQWPNKLVPRVIGGFPTANWGTTGVAWDWHGNMCSTDVLGMAPNAQIYDIRISDGATIAATISNALAGVNWAINQFTANGTPQILTNSWGIFQKSWDTEYATNPDHPFTKKVVEALDKGIIILFAAGNCGATCPDGRCGTDNGPGKSIWGANSHPRVMTVGAVNKNEQFVGYSSQGPGALDPNKPDFCSVTHFTGFFNSDSGTSAATPIAAGIVALLKQANPALTQDQVKAALKTTAKDIGPAGFDQHSGTGIIRGKAAYDSVAAKSRVSGPVVAWGPNRLDAFVVGTDSALYHKWWSGSAWGPSVTGYENQGGVVVSDPESVAWGPNRLDVFVIGTNRGLYHKWWNGSSWGPSLTGYEAMGGVIRGKPKAVSWGPNRLDLFVIGMDSALYHKWWNGSAWGPSLTGYEAMGGVIQGSPEAVSWGPNRLDVFVLGSNFGLFHKWWNGSAWGPSLTGYEFMGGTIVSQPKAVAWGPNRLDVFVVGTDSALYHKWWNGSAWGPSLTGYENMGGTIVGTPEVVSWGPNRLDVFAIGTNSRLYHKWWNGSAWGPSLTGWEDMGGTIVGQPRVVAWGPNRLDVFVIGTDGALYHKWWNGSAWGPSLTGYENLGGTIIRFSSDEALTAAAVA